MDFLAFLGYLGENLLQILFVGLFGTILTIIQKPTFCFSGTLHDKLLKVIEKGWHV
jgi:hypothetical protein